MEGGNTPRTHGQCRILYPEDHPTTHPFSTSRPPRLVRQNEPDSVDLYERVKKKLTFSRLMTFTAFIKYSVYDYRSFRVSSLSIIINLFKKQQTHGRYFPT